MSSPSIYLRLKLVKRNNEINRINGNNKNSESNGNNEISGTSGNNENSDINETIGFSCPFLTGVSV